MHFLCLHGKGTNTRILEVQLRTVQYQLGDGHTYEFVEGTVPEQPAPEIQTLFPSSDKYFGYFNEHSLTSYQDALSNLERYIEICGPFDGVIAFSQGVTLASTLLVRQAQESPRPGHIKVAIFFSGGPPVDPGMLDGGVIVPLDGETTGEVIDIPTAHIYGSIEHGELEEPPKLLALCKAGVRERFEHCGGHEIPGSKDRVVIVGVIQAMRRAIWRAGATST
ncbi:hypothetical protein P280DRAFT_422540 [Massarina eburnea CBS 473.64]|uniref:Serine hydrolase domain-containing protein n=1 Tax=Massarina eburnea CBS 473.64 TaxID=1395130 RepID=A0A6A6S6Q8_9PLEO|nr:hypothetical protein P280DRAFT_422540 [Massarina eburnea CBS 473.64]